MSYAQAITGVTPFSRAEATVMTVWPSNALYGLGRLLGRLYSISWGSYIFRLGNLLALLTMPLGALLYLIKIAPGVGTRYRLTNRRVVVERGILGAYERSVDLDRFNQIDVAQRPGQAWYDAGDLIFRLDNTETFRLQSVSRPEAFRQTCLKSQRAYAGIKAVMA